MAKKPTEHRRCGCPEQYKGIDCPACRGTGLIPPVTRAEWEKVQAELAAIKAALPDDFSPSKDWKRSNTVNRVIWLREMFRSWKPNPLKPAESELLPCGQLRKLLRTVVTTLAVRQDKDGREDGLLKMLRDKLAAAKPAEPRGSE